MLRSHVPVIGTVDVQQDAMQVFGIHVEFLCFGHVTWYVVAPWQQLVATRLVKVDLHSIQRHVVFILVVVRVVNIPSRILCTWGDCRIGDMFHDTNLMFLFLYVTRGTKTPRTLTYVRI